ncbi:MAG: peptidoglycan DD-metalloendopeptidase family protein [Planctomycetota bacterium]|jgi:murein DD-endopeptidase MepM/ murein hydrolase activator NlpD
MSRISPTAVVLLAALLPALAADEAPRADHKVINLVNDAKKFAAVAAQVEPLVVAHGKAKDDAARRAAADRIVSEVGVKGIEVLVRYREGHLVPVFARLAEAEEWYVRRLAIFGLQRNLALSELDRVVARLADENVLVREIAATTISILHFAGKKTKALVPREERAALKGLGKRRKADRAALEAALGGETNPYVASSITAAIEVLGKRPLLVIHEEPALGERPARMVPRTGVAEATRLAGKGFTGSGSGRLRPTSAWGYPTLLYPREVMNVTSDRPLVPLPEKGNALHFGHDCAWFLEGSSLYAIAGGVVRLVKSTKQWGGLIVVEHMTKKKEKVCALNGHCGMWVFVKPGETVMKGQLLGQIGLSFSPENGGHGAHDHLGMFEGSFSEGRCYGRGGAGRSTEGWLVPADFLTPRVAGEKLAPDSYK